MTSREVLPARGRRGLARLAALLLLPPIVGGCTGATPEAAPSQPATRAEQWMTSYHSAMRQGLVNLRRFLDEHVELDLTALGTPPISGRDEAIALTGTTFPTTDRTHALDGPTFYVSRDGVVEPGSVRHLQDEAPHMLLTINRMGSEGIAEQAYAVSELAWRFLRPGDARILRPHVVAQQWATGWGAGDAEGLGALYATEATLDDSLADVHATSREGITALASEAVAGAVLPGLTIPSMADLGGPAVFVIGTTAFDRWDDDPITTVTVLATADDGQACPGGVAAVLALDERGRIRHEERYHRLADLQRCAGGTLPAGWWDSLPIPAPVAVEPTGTLQLGTAKATMFNSSPGLDRLLQWAYERFTRARLAPPIVAQVTFYEPSIDLCAGVSGLAAGDQLSLCFTEPAACADASCDRWKPGAKGTTLHELGHAWMSTHTDHAVQSKFTAAAGLPTWASIDERWERRGVELAASVMAWGLMDEAYGVSRKFGAQPCGELASLFLLLTGEVAPAAATCQGEAPETARGPAGGANSGAPSG
jgi:hypothetical protein